jgi:hypothetical protein
MTLAMSRRVLHAASMRDADPAPDHGPRSIELWRGVSAACRRLEQRGDGDHPSAIAGVLRACGVDDRLFDVIGVQLVGHLPSPSAAARGAAGSSPPSTPDCVVRSTSGRISLKVILT